MFGLFYVIICLYLVLNINIKLVHDCGVGKCVNASPDK